MNLAVAVFSTTKEVGRTTISLVLAEIAAKKGLKVLLIEMRGAREIPNAVVYAGTLHSVEVRYKFDPDYARENCDMCILDMQPMSEQEEMLKFADIVLIPVPCNISQGYQYGVVLDADFELVYKAGLKESQVAIVKNYAKRKGPIGVLESFLDRYSYPVAGRLFESERIAKNLEWGRDWDEKVVKAEREPFYQLYENLWKQAGENVWETKGNLVPAPIKMLRGLIIDEEFASLIPPLAPEEFAGLEQSILKEGCRDAIITWNGIVIDGHNRYKICKKHNIQYQEEHKYFDTREEVKLWMLRNQLSRRNLTDFQRIEMVRKCEDAVRAQAKERQGTRTDMQSGTSESEATQSPTSGQNFPDVGEVQRAGEVQRVGEVQRATEELGAMAGGSRKTYEHAVTVLDRAPTPVVEAIRKKELSINAAYEVTRLPAEKQIEISERIEKGENPRKVVAEVKAKHGSSETEESPKMGKASKAENVSETEDVTLSIAVDVLRRVKALAEAQNMNIHATLLELINAGLSTKQQ